MYTKIHRPFFRLMMFGCSFFSGLLIAASFTMESSWSKVIYLGYPFDLLMVATLFCTLGQLLVDAVSSSVATECPLISGFFSSTTV